MQLEFEDPVFTEKDLSQFALAGSNPQKLTLLRFIDTEHTLIPHLRDHLDPYSIAVHDVPYFDIELALAKGVSGDRIVEMILDKFMNPDTFLINLTDQQMSMNGHQMRRPWSVQSYRQYLVETLHFLCRTGHVDSSDLPWSEIERVEPHARQLGVPGPKRGETLREYLSGDFSALNDNQFIAVLSRVFKD